MLEQAAILAALGRPEEAAAACERALDLEPFHAPAHATLSRLHAAAGDRAQALAAAGRALRLDPRCADAHTARALALLAGGGLPDADAADAVAAARAAAGAGGGAEAHEALARALAATGQPEAAAAEIAKSLRLRPDHAAAHALRAALALECGAPDAADAAARRAVALDPAAADGWLALAGAAGERGRPADAAAAARRARALHRPAAPGPRPAHAAVPPPAAAGSPGGRARIAYLLPPSRRDAAAALLEPLLAAHDRGAVELLLVDDGPAADESGGRLWRLADRVWRSAGMDDSALAARLAAERVAVLVDPAGDAGGRRAALFAAPSTTGPAALRVAWAGSLADPAAADVLLEEALYAAPPWAPPPWTPPAGPSAPPFAFASPEPLARLTPETVALWAAVLAACPGAVLRLGARSLASPARRAAVAAAFAGHGIAAGRLLCEPCPPAAAFEWLDHADALLEPAAGGDRLALCGALWMGVPGVALSAAGAGILARAGLPDGAAADPAGYVAAAARLWRAGRPSAAARAALRARVARSALCDGAPLARRIETLARAPGPA